MNALDLARLITENCNSANIHKHIRENTPVSSRQALVLLAREVILANTTRATLDLPPGALERYQKEDGTRLHNLPWPTPGMTLAQSMVQSRHAMTGKRADGCVLYETGDTDAPEAILDRNHEVVLACCRNCGRAEVQLDGSPCPNKQVDAEDGRRACVLRERGTDRQMDVEIRFEDSRDYHTNRGRFGKDAWAIVEDAPANDNTPQHDTLIPRDTPEAAHYGAAVAVLSKVVEPQRLEVMERLLVLQDVCHGLAAQAGWWIDMEDGVDVRTWPKKHFDNWVAAKLMLTVTEVAEAMEGHRKGLKDDKLAWRDMREVELADAVIRIFDLAGGLNYDLAGAIIEKLAFNMSRPDHKLENRKAAGGKSV